MNLILNTIEALRDQGPPRRFWRNLITLRLRGVLKPRSHWTREGKVKVGYGHKETAEKARRKMHEKTGLLYSSYKCFYCPRYHIGANGRRNPLPLEMIT